MIDFRVEGLEWILEQVRDVRLGHNEVHKLVDVYEKRAVHYCEQHGEVRYLEAHTEARRHLVPLIEYLKEFYGTGVPR